MQIKLIFVSCVIARFEKAVMAVWDERRYYNNRGQGGWS